MKKKSLLSILITVLLLFSNASFSQTVNLGILESFEGYTGAGAITKAAGATWTGDAGTQTGIISGFGAPPSFVGNTYNANAVTAQCRVDLFRLYIHLNDLFVDYPATHAPAFGGGETLRPGVYSIGGAGSIGGNLTLDGGGNPNAFFVIKFYGAMTVGAGAVVNLTGGTKSSNVFFIADGAISVAANANIKGTLFAKVGAVGLGTGAILEGRMLSLEGAIVAGVDATVSRPPDTCTIPIFCESGCSPASAVNVLGVLSNYALYTSLGAVPNTSTSGIDGNIGTNVGGISGFESSVVTGSFHTANASTAQAKIDLDNAYNSLMALPNTILTHTPAFGSVAAGGETITDGVYFIDGAGSLLGTLILDGQNNPNAIFVFKFAGAFSVAAQAKMILTNGARRCNVFFIGGAGVATGAIDIGAGAVLQGTFLSHGGACNSGASVFLAGRQLSTGGAVNTYSGIIYNNPVCVTSVSLSPPTAPTSGGNQTVCETSPIQTLTATATGSTITWYSAATGGAVVSSPTLNTVGTVTYYAESSNGTYPSLTRTAVTLTINGAPTAPTSGGNQTVCETSPIQMLTATATGGIVTWYSSATGGTVVSSPTLNTVGTVTYYAQDNGVTCSSLTRTAVSLTINSAPTAPTSGGNQTVCETSPIQTLTATATGGTITWYSAATGGTVVSSPTLNAVGTVTYYAQDNGATCSSLTRTAVTLTINGAPTAPTSGGNQTVCETSPIQTLTATATGGTITWYSAAKGGTVVSSPTLNTVGTVTYYAQDNGVTCSSLTRTAVTLTINGTPTAPTSGGNQTVCETSPIQTLTATATGNTITWYSAATGGTVVSSPTLNTVGTVTYYAQDNGATCSSLTRTAVTLTINGTPTAPTSGGNQTVCETSPIQMLTATATGGIVTWYSAATGGTVVSSPTLNTVGTVTYYAQDNGVTCSSLTRTAVTLTINGTPTAPTSGGNQTVCETSPIQTLTATATGGIVTWYSAATGGTVVSSPTLNTVGTVTYYAQDNGATCSSLTRTAVTLTINGAPTAPTSGGNQTVYETSPIQTLTATATGGIVTWYSAATGGTVVSSPTLNTVGTVTYYAQDNGATCSSLTRTAVTLTINGTSTALTSGGNQTVCETSPIQTLTATATGGTITWYSSATGGTVVSSPTLNTVGTVTYYAESSNSLTRTAVTLTINGTPTAPTSGGNQTVCETSPIQTLTATATGGTITWYSSATGGTVVSSPTLNTVGIVTYYAQNNGATCSSLTRTAVTLTINGAPTAPTSGGNQTVCETSPIQMLTATATGGIVTWYSAATGGTVVSSPTLNTVGTVTYYAQNNGATCSSLTRTAVTLTINGTPTAPTSGGNQTVCETSPIQTLTATATGGIVTWYSAATGGTVVSSPTLNTVGTVTYYAQNNGVTCSSLTRTAVTLTINGAPTAPTSGGNQTVCETSPIQTLTATATGGIVTWYSAATGGTVVSSPTLNTVGTVTYYAQNNGVTCSSLTRTAVTLTINGTPTAPTSGGNQTVCETSPIQTLTATATGGIVTWYSAATGGTVVSSPTLNTVGTVTYYAQNNGVTCSSLTRTAVTLTINGAPTAPTSGGNQTVCETSPIQTLTATATGGIVTWYSAATGGTVVSNPTLNTVGTVTYYAQNNGVTCSSLTRTAVTLTINGTPTAPTSGGNQTVCETSPIQTLTATATGGIVTWYSAATGGTVVSSPTLNTVGTVTYYAQNNGVTCSSLTRTAVTLTINGAPTAPTSGGNQNVYETSPIQTLTATATGNTITWYSSATGGTVVSSPTLNTVGTVTYYAESSNATCSSLTRTAVSLTINGAPKAPVIVAVTDYPSVLPGSNTPSVILNDKVNGVQAVIGTSPGQVTLTSTPSGPLTMNPDGTITVASNTPAGSYPISYTICEVSNPTNCSTVTSNVSVIAVVTDSPYRIPNGISPNNDGLNDRFIIQNLKPTDKVSITIYNRLQSLVFRDANYKNNFEGVGNQKGLVNNDLPDGTYYYILNINDSKPITGYIIINR